MKFWQFMSRVLQKIFSLFSDLPEPVGASARHARDMNKRIFHEKDSNVRGGPWCPT